MCISALGNIGFGFLTWLTDSQSFFWSSIILRVLTALGESVISPASYPLAARQLGEQNKAKALSVAESCFGVGLMFGPPVGGVLYSVGGFYAPFWTCAFVELVIICMAIYLFGQQQELKEEKTPLTTKDTSVIGWKTVLQSPKIVSSFIALTCTSCSWYWYQASLEPFLQDSFDFDEAKTGLVFMAGASSYSIATPVFGFLIDKGFSEINLIIFGNLLVTVAYLFLGPIPFLSFLGSSYWFTTISILLQGVGTAAAYLGSLCFMLQSGLPDTEQAESMVSSLYVIGDCMEAYVGAATGGLAYQVLGFKTGSYIPSVFMAIVTLGLLLGRRWLL